VLEDFQAAQVELGSPTLQVVAVVELIFIVVLLQ
jgi:hypothetical protein